MFGAAGRVRVVPDTNIVLTVAARRSSCRGVLDAWERGACELGVSTEVLLEHEEKLTDNFGPVVADLTVTAFLAWPGPARHPARDRLPLPSAYLSGPGR